MNDEEFTEEFKQGVRSMTRSECFFGELTFPRPRPELVLRSKADGALEQT